MMHIPMQKWQGKPEHSGCYAGCFYYTDSCFRSDCKKPKDRTLADYIARKTDTPPKKTFEEYMNEKIETPVGLRTREHAWGEQKTAIAREVWMEARK